MKNNKYLTVALILLIPCAGCARKTTFLGKPLDTAIDSIVVLPVDIDANDFIVIKEGVEVSYILDKENEKIIFTLTKKDQTEILEIPVVFVEEKELEKDYSANEADIILPEDISADNSNE